MDSNIASEKRGYQPQKDNKCFGYQPTGYADSKGKSQKDTVIPPQGSDDQDA